MPLHGSHLLLSMLQHLPTVPERKDACPVYKQLLKSKALALILDYSWYYSGTVSSCEKALRLQ